jgi:N utilization substance protein B
MGRRRKARELAVQVLYQCDLVRADPEEAMALFWENFRVEVEVRAFCRQLVLGTLDRLALIDDLLGEASEHWSLGRMSVVDRNILRLGIHELLDRSDIPPSVSMNEAIEIAKKYSTPDAAVFINGVLDRVERMVHPVSH